MKRLICMLLACLMLCASALAEPRCPAKGGATVDDAAVLSQSTVEELRKLHELVKKDTDIELYVVTVDFLDGYSIDAYGEALMDAWDLDDDALLILMAVGEDKCASFSGEDVKLSRSVQSKLIATSLEPDFLRQNYDAAVRAYAPALVTEIGKVYGTRISLDGLFGVADTQEIVDWVDRFAQEMEARSARVQESIHQRVEQEDDDDGMSLGKVILTVIFLMMIFGKKGRGRRGGCGCAPFAGLFGLWKLWGRD